jgi:YtcA family
MRRFRDLQGKSRRSSHSGRLRLAAIATGAIPMLASTGCSRVPSFNILGSFFPSWLLCGIVGIVLTVVVRILFVRTNFEKELSPLVLVYPCLAAFFTFSIWLLLFS